MRYLPFTTVLLVTLMIAFTGCGELLKEHLNLKLGYPVEQTFKVPAFDQTGYHEFAQFVLSSDVTEFLEDNNVDYSTFDRATISEVTLTILTPGVSFDILSDVKVEVELEGQRHALAVVEIPEGETTELTVPVTDELNVATLLQKESATFYISGTLEKPLEVETEIQARVKYELALGL